MNAATRSRSSDVRQDLFAPLAITLAASIAFAGHAQAQGRRAVQPTAQASAQAGAPIDITGHWVSLITDDWVYRMITPAKGDYSYVPLNAEGRRLADTWDPARDSAAGEECKAHAAPAIMRLPSRVHITWEDESTLQLDIDNGMQTRLFHFGEKEPQGARTWQGWSYARWELSGNTDRQMVFADARTSLGEVRRQGSLQVDTSNLRAGYLRKNGVPFSEDAFMTEYYNLITEEDGNQYLVIQTFVEDPRYLTRHFVRTLQFKREPDGSKRNPVPCSAT
ncbi:MAG TPA: hypothetical protein VJA26_00300 [Gammaproteobacteria bacterium]|nr:hypothetical protein [Gammaproteobacteria bacterium]